MDFIFPIGKYKGEKYSEIVKRDVQYLHWLVKKDWFKENYTDQVSIIIKTLPKEAKYIRTIRADEVEKTKRFNLSNINNILKLSITRTWGNRTLSVKSKEWRDLRQIILKDKGCRFCGLKLKKYMIVDHIDGDASNNNLTNLGVNCPTCDRIRHCGLAGTDRLLILRYSELPQVVIVQKTHAFLKKYNRIPLPEEIDPDCKQLNGAIQDTSGKMIYIFDGKDVYSNLLANILLKYNYEELIGAESIKGFFTDKMSFGYIVQKRVILDDCMF
jgi:hypothetical protein